MSLKFLKVNRGDVAA